MTNGNHTISRSGVFFPALLTRTGTSLEDFELYGSLRRKAQHCFRVHPRTEKRLLIVVDTDKGGARSNETGHGTLAEEEPLEHGKKCLARRVQEVKRVAGLAAKADWAR